MSVRQTKSHLNQEDFQELHRKYRDRLHASITGFLRDADTAEDITASAFATAWSQRASFRAEASPYTWLYSIGKNAAVEHYRKTRKVRLESFDDPARAEYGETDCLAETFEKSERGPRIRQALGRLPATHRRVLVDHFIHGRAVRHIAQREGIPVGTVLSRIFTAKRLLRQAWEAAT